MLSALNSIRTKLINMIQRVRVAVAAVVKPGTYYIVQVSNTPISGSQPTYNKTQDVEVIFPYGLVGSLPLNALGVKINIQGESSNPVIIAYDPSCFPALQAGGEVAVGAFSSPTGAYFKCTIDGRIEVWKKIGGLDTLVISDLITHLHTGGTLGGGLTGPPNP